MSSYQGNYGLKHASCAWNQLLTKILFEIGFLGSTADTCLLVYPEKLVFIALYIDYMTVFDLDEASV